MRERIGVFVGEAFGEYQKSTLQAINARAKELNYDVFVFASFGAYGDNLLYAEGEQKIFSLPNFSDLSGVIVEEDTFDIAGMDERLEKILREKCTCPVVYLKIPKDGFYNVLTENKQIMKDITRHFVKEHGITDICYMSGKKEYLDARERLSGFLEVMQEEQIEVTEHMIFHGDYWHEKGKEAIDWFMTGRTTYPRAIICANDYMALSICIELEKRGVRIPEDVMVSGFDNVGEAKQHDPCLTTAEVPLDEMGSRAVDIIDNVAHGKAQERVEWIDPKLILGESCGCGTRNSSNSSSQMMGMIYRQFNAMKRIVFMTTDCQDAFKKEELLTLAERYAFDNFAKKLWICLNEETESNENEEEEKSEDEIGFTQQMVLHRIFEMKREVVRCEKKFPITDLLPEEYMDTDEPQMYMIFSIHYRNKSYGYMVMTLDNENWIGSFTQAYLTVLANGIEDINMHRAVSGLTEIRALYMKDTLTGIYNRRGFEKKLRIIGETNIDRKIIRRGMKPIKKYVSAVSIDMDGLKYINDNFGHAEGDDALRRLAKVMKSLAEPGEVYARTGGDEFAMILLSDTPERHEKFEEIFMQAMAEEEKRISKPYPFHASIGISCITESADKILMKCVKIADERMYVQKRKYKASREKLMQGQ